MHGHVGCWGFLPSVQLSDRHGDLVAIQFRLPKWFSAEGGRRFERRKIQEQALKFSRAILLVFDGDAPFEPIDFCVHAWNDCLLQ